MPEDICVFPMAIPMLAGPGSIASTMLLMARSRGLAESPVVLAALDVMVAIDARLQLAAGPLMRALAGQGGGDDHAASSASCWRRWRRSSRSPDCRKASPDRPEKFLPFDHSLTRHNLGDCRRGRGTGVNHSRALSSASIM